MEITVKQDRVLVLKDHLARPEAESVAWRAKSGAFGALNQVTSFLNRPKDEDFKLTSQDHSYLPFWHIVGTATYDYERKVRHSWPVSGPEVTTLTLADVEYPANQGTIAVTVLEHCHQAETTTLLIDGLTGVAQPTLSSYLTFANSEVDKEELQKIAEKNQVIPPKTRASSLVRDTASKMIHSIEADQVFEESVVLEKVDLYYRPVYSFTYNWLSKNKQARVDVDGLTGEVNFNQKNLPDLMQQMIDYDFLFDIGADAAGTFIPGGSIAVKLAKKYMESKKK